MANLVQGKGPCRSGAAVVEMAIVLPLLLLLTMGLMEYGWMFIKVEQLNQVATQTARLSIRADVTTAEATAAANAKLASVGLSTARIVFSPGDISTAAPGSPISVDLTVPYSDIVLTKFSLLPVPQQIHSKVTMAKEGG